MLLKNAILALGLMLISNYGFAVNDAFNSAQQQQIRQIVHDYLVKNPGILVEASQALQRQEEQDIQKRAIAAIPSIAQQLFHNSISPVLGNPHSDVAVVEFFDYQCSHCKNMTPAVTALLSTDKNIRIIYKQLPIFGPNSIYAARAALAAMKQGGAKFLAFNDGLMKADNPVTQTVVLKVAQQAGLDINQLQTDLGDTRFDQELKANNAMASALGVVGTPAIVVASNIDNKNSNAIKAIFISGEVNQAVLQQAIAEVRK